MKTMKKYKSILALIVISLFLSVPTLMSQMMAPGEPGEEPDPGDDPIGGGAPLSGGSLILIGFAAAYGSKKVYNLSQKTEK